MQLEPTKFIDKNGVEIKAGNLIKISHMYENRQFRDRKEFWHMEDGSIRSKYNEGDVIGSSLEWVTFRVQWFGACMRGVREDYSTFGKYTNMRELPIQECCIDLDGHFESELFEVLQESSGFDSGFDNSVSLVKTLGG
jgi:hypothetical protein